MFSENDRKNALLASIAIFLMIVACAGSIRLYKQAVPEQVEHDTRNYGLDAYQQALDKWTASGVDSYEMTIHGGDDVVILRVSNGGGSIEVLSHLHQDRPISETGLDEYSASLRTRTVESMFELAQEVLDTYETDGTETLRNPSDERYIRFYDFEVRFDERLGYPTYMGEYERTTTAAREITWRQRPWAPIEVTDFKVLNSR